MAGSYNAMRCALLDEQADLYIERVREFVDQVKDMITNPELPLLESEEALKRAFTVFNQTLKTEGDGDEDPRLAKEIPEKRMSDMFVTGQDSAGKDGEPRLTPRHKPGQSEASAGSYDDAASIPPSVSVVTAASEAALSQISHIGLKLRNQCLINFPVNNSVVVTDAAILSNELVIIAEYTPATIKSEVKIYSLDGQFKDKSSNIMTPSFNTYNGHYPTKFTFDGKIKVAVMWPNGDFAVSMGGTIQFSSMSEGKILHFRTMYNTRTFEVGPMAALSPTMLAATVSDKIKIVDIDNGMDKFMITTKFNATDMCYIPDGTLVLYDDKYVWRADPFSGHVKKVVRVDSVASMTGCSDGVLFVKNKSVYLIGRDTDKVQLVLSLAGRLKKEDKLLHISAQGNICVCYTQFGFMLVFDITR